MKSKAAPFIRTSGGQEESSLLNEHRCWLQFFFLLLFFFSNQGRFGRARLQKRKKSTRAHKREILIHVNTWLILQAYIIHQQTAFQSKKQSNKSKIAYTVCSHCTNNEVTIVSKCDFGDQIFTAIQRLYCQIWVCLFIFCSLVVIKSPEIVFFMSECLNRALPT